MSVIFYWSKVIQEENIFSCEATRTGIICTRICKLQCCIYDAKLEKVAAKKICKAGRFLTDLNKPLEEAKILYVAIFLSNLFSENHSCKALKYNRIGRATQIRTGDLYPVKPDIVDLA